MEVRQISYEKFINTDPVMMTIRVDDASVKDSSGVTVRLI